MEGVIIVFAFFGLIYYFYYEHIYKRSKNYKEKQIINLAQEADQLLANNDPGLQKTQTLVDELLTREERVRFVRELLGKSEQEKALILKKMMQPEEKNLTDKAAAQRVMLLLDKFKGTNFKYIRLMERLKYGSVDDRLKVTQDWNDYVKLFISEKSADNIQQVLVYFEEIEKRFNDRLEVK